METLILTFLVSITLGLTQSNAQPQEVETSTILVRVTSDDSNSEAVVECAYIVDDEKRTMQVIEKTTPFEIRVNANIYYALFRQKSESGFMSASLYTIKEEGQISHVSGSGKAFVLGYRHLQEEGVAKDGRKEKKRNGHMPTSFISVF
ncbi:MAG: hypothetical protein HYZ01_04245 [Ignavibacteriales bacterium]|nr:hypothetical protein [Ignavibacteriales bacterium]